MIARFAAFAAALLAAAPVLAQADPTEAAFRDIYKELVETNTTLSAGSCTLAAERMAARLEAAGFPDSDLHLIVEPSHPKEGNLVAMLPGTDPQGQGDPAARPYRRGRGQARRLGARSVHPRRGGRLLLRARRRRRQSPGGDLGRHAGPLQARGLPAEAHDQDGADLRRGDGGRLQRRPVSRRREARPDRRRIRPQRRRRRPARRRGQAGRPRHPGGREIPAELPARSHQSRRPQLAPGHGQCDLPARRRAGEDRAPTISRSSRNEATRGYFEAMAKLLPGPVGAGHGRLRRQSGRRGGRGHPRRRRSGLERDPAHHLRRHPARRRPRHQRLAAAGPRQRQLPDLPRHLGRAGPPGAGADRRRSRR